MDPMQTERILRVDGAPAEVPADCGSPEAVVSALYEAISGPAESAEARNWDRFRALFLPGAKFLLTRWGTPESGEQEVLRQWDVEECIAAARWFWANSAFHEREIWSRCDRFGNAAQVFSTYESRVGSRDSLPVGRGINSIQLARHAERWWIASVVWDVERPQNPIPPEYLPRELEPQAT